MGWACRRPLSDSPALEVRAGARITPTQNRMLARSIASTVAIDRCQGSLCVRNGDRSAASSLAECPAIIRSG